MIDEALKAKGVPEYLVSVISLEEEAPQFGCKELVLVWANAVYYSVKDRTNLHRPYDPPPCGSYGPTGRSQS